jgi:hypothetical protein
MATFTASIPTPKSEDSFPCVDFDLDPSTTEDLDKSFENIHADTPTAWKMMVGTQSPLPGYIPRRCPHPSIH